MILSFFKYHGTGNDFILIDERSCRYELSTEQISRLCNRNFGIGADGLMLLQEAPGYHFRMVYYNSDGKESTMCGNGGRSMISFARHLGLISAEAFFVAADGEHHGTILSAAGDQVVVKLKMKDVEKITFEKSYDFLDTGSPHAVLFVEDTDAIDVVTEGRKIRYNRTFSEVGTNVNFVEIVSSGLKVRSYERGVENETLSCGTGVTASVLAYAFKNQALPSPCRVETNGGELFVHFARKGNGFGEVWLEGPATYVFKGEIEIS